MAPDDNPFAPPGADHPAVGGRPRMTVLRTYPLAAMAELDRALLAEQEIVGIVESGDLSSFTAVGQAVLSVRPEDRAAALALLDAPLYEGEDAG